MNKKILLLGPFPPPVGGVSIHLHRFLSRFKAENDHIINLVDLKRLKSHGDDTGGLLLCIKSFFQADLIHIHLSSNIKLVIAFISKVLGKKVVYTHHNSRVNSPLLFGLLVRLCDRVILVNDREIDLDYINKFINRVTVIPAFIPPVKTFALPEAIRSRISQSSFIVSTNCSVKAEFNGKDLYGFDIVIEAFSNFINSRGNSDSLLVLVDPSATSKSFIDKCLNNWPIPDKNLLIVDYNIDFYSLVKESNVIIRSARTDGDSLSVREGLFTGCTVLASDSTWRPNGVITYPTESAYDLSLLLRRSFEGDSDAVVEKEDYFSQVIQVYDVCLSASKD